ncbi:MAG TPA: VIT1/CCC1 transporter family protein [Caulobacteraceae bacterium]|jgi:VIT1/CCC1 family predicted Fe2+/Mn2+ transporter|nr:VIT1/CCC1 transporter family protein [Caulobacteraceae bacterium]
MTGADLRRLKANLQMEVDGATVYAALADAEDDARLASVYRQLADIETGHADYWRSRLPHAGARPSPSLRARTLSGLARILGAKFILPAVASSEARGAGDYDGQPDAVARGLAADERSHARVIKAAVDAGGGLGGQAMATLEGRHRTGGGNAFRAAVLGANDGLASNLSLVMGMAGATGAHKAVLLAGVAGLVAGACSMAIGEWLSVSSARELFQAQIRTEAEELERSPEEEKQELALIYQAKGLGEAEAWALADRLLSDKDVALQTLVREELGIDPDNLGGSPWTAAASSFAMFAAGAIVPVAPFFFLDGAAAILAALVVSGLVLALVGVATSLFTGRGAAFSALRQVCAGYAAAAITFGVGRLVGVAVE